MLEAPLARRHVSHPLAHSRFVFGNIVTRPLLIVVVTVVVVAASYYGFSRFAATSVPTSSVGRSAGAPTAMLPRTFTIVIDKANPPAPSAVIRVARDDPVTLTITSDRAGHVEVHGYAKEVAVEPGTTATLSFTATRTGRFPIDLHAQDGAHVEVTALEVMPR